MDLDICSYEAMCLAYDVAFDLSRELEKACIAGEFVDSLLSVLSGCYSVVDYYSNCIAALDVEDDEVIVEERDLTLRDYENAVFTMQGHINLLNSNISDERSLGRVNYQKVHALVGLKVVADYILQAIGR